jgi:class 3 adenylate cyclase/predicted ATPase
VIVLPFSPILPGLPRLESQHVFWYDRPQKADPASIQTCGGGAVTFEEVLTQTVAMLQRFGRVSYRALQRQFDLDDAYLEDLKEAVLYAYPTVLDDVGRGLIWPRHIETPPEAPLASSQPAPPPLPQEGSPPPPDASPRALPSPDAERRQLTVLFCDLVDSTTLSAQLDPEEYRDVVRAYHTACTEVIRRYDGHIAQLLGDGLLVYFGYPQAHEDDAHRAVRTGLEILAAMASLQHPIAHDTGIRLAVRLGVHTGVVVIGAMGGAGRQEQLALGDVPNIAARLQGLAQPDTVVVSQATYRLTHGYFDCDALGEQVLRGLAEPMAVYRVRRASGAHSRLEIATPRGLTPLVGRESEVTLLRERWAHAKEGQGQVMVLSGEAGIGKSRLVQVLKDQLAGEPHTLLECRSLPYYQQSALYPIIELLPRLLLWQPDASLDAQLDQLTHALRQYRLPEQDTMPLLAPLLSLALPADRYPPLQFSPENPADQRHKTYAVLLTMLLELAAHRPVLLVLEDMHWTDPSTLELLALLMDQIPTVSFCALLTCRPTFQPSWSPRSYLTQVTLNRLSRPQSEWLAEHVAGGKRLPAEVLRQIVEKTDGVPLFVEEMTKAILESGYLTETDAHYEVTGPLPALAIPATLHDSLMARLDRLVTAKAVAQYASVLGRHFSYAVLQAVAQLDEPTLQRELARLVDAELLYQRGLPPQATYLFKHALIRDIAYESLLRSTRQGYHQRVATVLEAQFPETVATHPELLAQHCTEGGLNEQAVRYWHQAGQHAIQRAAHAEAVTHLRQGLAVLTTLPPTPGRARQELALQTVLGPALMAVRGYGAEEVEHVYQRARALSQEVNDTAEQVRALMGLYVIFFVRANHQAATALADELLQLGQAVQDPLVLLQTHATEGESLGWQGQFALARTRLEHALSFYRPQRYDPSAYFYGHNPVVQNLSSLAELLWFLGYPEQAVQQCDQALTFARGLSHPFSFAFALCVKVQVHQWRRETTIVQEQAEALLTLSTEHGFPFRATIGSILLGWAMAERGEGEAGIARIEEGIAAWQTIGARMLSTWWLGLRAEAYGKIGQVEAALTIVVDALRAVENTGERFYEAELYRLRGVFLLQRSVDNQHEAETCFQHALAIAQDQGATAWELRTATSLARLWQQQGKGTEAHELLAPIYGWFTEGFDTTDLQEAKALLAALEG